LPHRHREEFLLTLLRRHARLGCMKPFFRIEKGGEESGEEILTIQLIENLQRQEIDPIDKANAIVSFVLARHTDMDADGIINELISLRRDEKRVANEFALTVSAIAKIAGISTATMLNLL
jgi:ParB-like chromosome segregation protein Spo0J